MAASRTPAGPKGPAAAAFKSTSHGSSAAAASSRTRPPPLPRRPGLRRPQQQQQQQQQRYFGRMSSNVTDHLKKVVPSHAFHPSLLPLPVPSFHRKASSISAYIESQVRPPPQPRRPYTAPDVYFGRRASNVTDHLRYIPPSHLGADAHSKSLPYFGRLATSVTDPSKYVEAGNGDSFDSITCHWSAGSRPGSARLPVPPQHVSKEILFHALSARGERPHGGSHPTNIGSLLRHQFTHLLGEHTEHEQKIPFPNTTPQPLVPVSDNPPPSEPGDIKNSNDATAFCSLRSVNKRIDEDGHEPATNCGQILRHGTVQRPGTAPAAECSTKRTRHSNTNNTLHHFPSPRMLASPRPPASPRPASARASVACDQKRVLKQLGEPSPRRKAREETVNAKRNAQESSNARTANDEAGRAEAGEEAAAMMMENGQGMTSGGEGGQSTLCDDKSSEGSEQVGSEKLELVRQWVEQEDQPHFRHSPASASASAAWSPKPVDKVVNHSRRATSITKYNIW